MKVIKQHTTMLLIYAGIKLCDFGIFWALAYIAKLNTMHLFTAPWYYIGYIGYIPSWYEFLKVSVSGKR